MYIWYICYAHIKQNLSVLIYNVLMACRNINMFNILLSVYLALILET